MPRVLAFGLALTLTLSSARVCAVHVSVANDHLHGFYYPAQETKLQVTVTDDAGRKLTSGTVTAELDDFCGSNVFRRTTFRLADANPFKLGGKLGHDGVLRLRLWSEIPGFPKRDGYDCWAEAYPVGSGGRLPRVTAPKDFDAHWERKLSASKGGFVPPSGLRAAASAPARLVLALPGRRDEGGGEDEARLTVVVDPSETKHAEGRTAAILKCVHAANWLAGLANVDPPRRVYLEDDGTGLGFAVLALNRRFTRAAVFSPAVMTGGDPYLDDRVFASRVTCPVNVTFADLDPVTPPPAMNAVGGCLTAYDKTVTMVRNRGSRIADDVRGDVLRWLANPPESEPLWPVGRIPGYRDFQTVPEMEWYAPTNRNRTKTCIIIAPGGGYSGIAYQHEGLRTARNFLALGMHVVLLRYRTPPSGLGPTYQSAWQDAQRCVRIVRSQAQARGIDPEKIGMTGFSAGGHLTCVTACNSQTPAYSPVDEIDRFPCHLNFAAPVYPAYLLKYPTVRNPPRGEEVDCPFTDDLAFDGKTPPMCFVHGDDDGHSAIGSIRAYERLRRLKIRGEIHVFSGVNHAFGGSIRHGGSPSGWEMLVANFAASVGKMSRIDAFRWPDEREGGNGRR